MLVAGGEKPASGHPPLVRAVLVGVTGRMGQALLRVAPAFAQVVITGAIASPVSLALGRDAGEVAGSGRSNLAVTSDLPRALEQADVVLDFSSPAATEGNLRACRQARKALLLGTTGLGADLDEALTAASRDIPLLTAANTSVGVGVLTELVRAAARGLPASFDIDVLELHHRLKPDAPSGTALALGAAAAAARGWPPPAPGGTSRAAGGTPGPDAAAARLRVRAEGEIGFTSVRAGDLVGEHTVLFSGVGEQLTLTHRATDRTVFARGAFQAALWLASQAPGRYTMGDFLGGKTVT
jgi:4-hydroxy-tetrahydrodipicolinate reductase